MNSQQFLRMGGKIVCIECQSPIPPNIYGGKARRPPQRCSPCRMARHLRMRGIQTTAASHVAKAVRDGLLTPASELVCVDCALAPAIHYDPRDYTKPLNVAPVCMKCNFRRGYADVWAEDFHPSAKPGQSKPAKAAA